MCTLAPYIFYTSEYRDEGLQEVMYSLEDVRLCAEAGRVSAAVSSQVCFINVAEGGHELLEVSR